MSIHELTKVIPPPRNKIETGSAKAWKDIERRLGLRLPSESKVFGNIYGSGTFCGSFLTVFNPFASNYLQLLNDSLDSLRAAKKRGMKFNVWPESSGLFPWGQDENGNTYCWLTEGEPDKWTVAIRKHGNEDIIKLPVSMSVFLVKSFRNELSTSIWQGEAFSDEELRFMPQNT